MINLKWKVIFLVLSRFRHFVDALIFQEQMLQNIFESGNSSDRELSYHSGSLNWLI